jgi:hypothetical protein
MKLPKYFFSKGKGLPPMGVVIDIEKQFVAKVWAWKTEQAQRDYERQVITPHFRVPGYGIYLELIARYSTEHYPEAELYRTMQDMALFYMLEKMSGNEGYYKQYSYKLFTGVSRASDIRDKT